MRIELIFAFLLLLLSGFSESIEANGLRLSFDRHGSVSSLAIDGDQVSPADYSEPTFRFVDVERDYSQVTENILDNPDFEDGGSGWRVYHEGYDISTTTHHSGSRSLKLVGSKDIKKGVSQHWRADSSSIKIDGYIKISGWSKAVGVSDGKYSEDYSVWVDVENRDGTETNCLSLPFSPGTHDWEYNEVVYPVGDVKDIRVYVLLRKREGIAYFDDISVTGVSLPSFEMTSVSKKSGKIITKGKHDKAKLGITATYYPINGRSIGAAVKIDNLDPSRKNRPLKLMFSVPFKPSNGGKWGYDICQIAEFGEQSGPLESMLVDATDGFKSGKYMYSAVSDDDHGVSMAIQPKTAMYPFQFSYNPKKSTLTVTADFMISTANTDSPTSAEFHFEIFRLTDPEWNFRSAVEDFAKIHPMEPRLTKQGTWFPFFDLSKIPDFEDFGIQFYEGHHEPEFLNEHGVYIFNYIEPTMVHIPYEGSDDDSEIQDYLRKCPNNRRLDPDERRECRELHTSAMIRSDGGYSYAKSGDDIMVPTSSASNVIPHNSYEIRNEWLVDTVDKYYRESRASKDKRITGIYLDSLEMYTYRPNYNKALFSKGFTNVLVYDKETHEPISYMGQHTYQFTKEMYEKVVEGEKGYLMANTVLFANPHYAHYLDVLGIETNWMSSGRFRPVHLKHMVGYRTNSYRKPYLILQNADFSRLTSDMIREFFDICLAVGVFPNFFHSTAGYYYEHPEFYERDRPIFKEYMPYFRLTGKHWNPITHARVVEADPEIPEKYYTIFERWGTIESDGHTKHVFTFRLDNDRNEDGDTEFDLTLDFSCSDLGCGRKGDTVYAEVGRVGEESVVHKLDGTKLTLEDYEICNTLVIYVWSVPSSMSNTYEEYPDSVGGAATSVGAAAFVGVAFAGVVGIFLYRRRESSRRVRYQHLLDL